MAQFPVTAARERALLERMRKAGLREEDMEESFVRSGGHGGQNVNKTATCVYLVHRPTGTEVKCQRDRSQALNRYHARVTMVEKIEALTMGAESPEARRIAKLKKQKTRRARRAVKKHDV